MQNSSKSTIFSIKKHKIKILRTNNSAPNVSIFTYDTFLERRELIDYHYYLIIYIIQNFVSIG